MAVSSNSFLEENNSNNNYIVLSFSNRLLKTSFYVLCNGDARMENEGKLDCFSEISTPTRLRFLLSVPISFSLFCLVQY